MPGFSGIHGNTGGEGERALQTLVKRARALVTLVERERERA